MAIDEKLEASVAESRGRIRQSKTVPLLIRDDGMLVPNVPLIARKSNFRPYTGRPDASLEDRMRFLNSLGAKRKVVVEAEDEAPPFVLGKATKDEIVAFAQEQFGVQLDPGDHMNKLRAEVAKLAGIDGRTAQRARNDDSAQAAA